MYTEIELFLLFIIVLLQHLKISSYTLQTPFKMHSLKDNSVIYSYQNKKNNKKALIFLSGASQFKFTYYIKKLVDDLLLYTHIHKTYDIFVFENTHEVNYLCVDNIYQWIQQYIHPKYNNITICGLSNGGCIGSHVMKTIVNNIDSNIHQYKLITIDSVFNMRYFLKKMEKNIFFRKDICIAYANVMFHSLHHTHLQSQIDIFDIIRNNNYTSFLQYFEKMYGINQKSFEKKSKFQLNIGEKCDIINIYSINDPIIERELNKKYYKKQQLKNKVQSNIKNISFNTVTHNSQMVNEKSSKKFCKLFTKCLENN